MVRTTSFRLNHPLLAVYQHRDSSYARRPGYVTLNGVAALFEPVKQEALEEFVLPQKQPTPDVILRDDILPHRRTHVAL
jgi:hypothetical protein